MNRKNMFWTYTILAGLCTILAVVFGILATYAEKKEEAPPLPVTNTTFNIKGDYVNRDKKVNEYIKDQKNNSLPTEDNVLVSKSKEENSNVKESSVNNGIINQAPNYGTQNVNNYNEKQPRKLNLNDINDIKNTIPKEYNVIISFVNSTEEAINYTNQIISELKMLNYHIIEINSIGVLAGGRPYTKDERYYIVLDTLNKKAEIFIREQK
jgi:hypothetical protein